MATYCNIGDTSVLTVNGTEVLRVQDKLVVNASYDSRYYLNGYYTSIYSDTSNNLVKTEIPNKNAWEYYDLVTIKYSLPGFWNYTNSTFEQFYSVLTANGQWSERPPGLEATGQEIGFSGFNRLNFPIYRYDWIFNNGIGSIVQTDFNSGATLPTDQGGYFRVLGTVALWSYAIYVDPPYPTPPDEGVITATAITQYAIRLSSLDGNTNPNYLVLAKGKPKPWVTGGHMIEAYKEGEPSNILYRESFDERPTYSVECITPIQCPEGTCFSCRDGDYVCCYDNNGVGTRVLDKEHTITTDC